MLDVILRASSSANTFYRERILSLSESRRASCGTRSRMAASLPLQTAKVGAGESTRGGGERERESPALSALHHHSAHHYHTRSVDIPRAPCVFARVRLLKRERWRESALEKEKESESESESESERVDREEARTREGWKEKEREERV